MGPGNSYSDTYSYTDTYAHANSYAYTYGNAGTGYVCQ
jgi:hypothetical protein